MAERGDFRGIYTVLPEDSDFQDLGPEAQLCWFHLKLKLGPSGIDAIDAAEAVLQERSKMPPERVSDGIDILIRRGWLTRDRNILWLRNALRFEPSRNLRNENHRKAVFDHLITLPKRQIVNDFAVHYDLPVPFPDLKPPGCHPDTKPITEDGRRSTETEDGEQRSHTRAREEFSTPEASGPPPEPPPAPAEAPAEGLAAWLGTHAHVLDGNPLVANATARNALFQLYGPPGLRPNAWARDDGSSVPPEYRPRLFAITLTQYAAEGNAKIVANEFAGMLRATFNAELRGVTTRNPAAEREASRLEAEREAEKRESARSRTSAPAPTKAADVLQPPPPEAEAHQDAHRWLGTQSDEVQARAKSRARTRWTAMYGETPSERLRDKVLVEIVSEMRGETAGVA